jgi:CMP-N-acetylneuraminic acid synthetase
MVEKTEKEKKEVMEVKVCLIPAKEKSERLPGKNMMLFNGKPLLEHTIELAQQVEFFDKIIVSTDIEQILAKYPGIATLEPGKMYHTGNVPIQELIMKIWEKYNPEFLFILNCTTPQRKVGDILSCANALVSGNFNSLITTNHDFSPNGCCQITRTGRIYDPPVCVFPTRIEMVDIDYYWEFRIAEALCRT